jgi:hypothetical protein
MLYRILQRYNDKIEKNRYRGSEEIIDGYQSLKNQKHGPIFIHHIQQYNRTGQTKRNEESKNECISTSENDIRDLNTKNQVIDHIIAISLLICPNAIASEHHNTNEKWKTAKE